jgi:hypothetical protein
MSDSIKKYHEMKEDVVFKMKPDPIVEKIRGEFRDRSEVGINKYGTTLAENELSLVEWMEHLKQELMDAILYLERAKDEISNRQSGL